MSTRSNVIIKMGKTEILLYRHCDGYLTGAGQDLHNDLLNSKFDSTDSDRYFNIAEFTAKLLSKDSDYRIDDQLAGDIEYLYIFEFENSYEHGEHYNRVALKSIVVDQDHECGLVGHRAFKTLLEFQDAIKSEGE